MDKGEQTYETDICGPVGAEPASACRLLEGRFAHGAVPDRACHAGSDRTGDRRSDGALQTEPATEPSQPTEEEGPFTVTYAHAQADTHGSGEVWVQLLAEVTNTGSEPLTLGAADWTVCTPDGTELAVRKGVSAYPQTIEPGEKGWYY